jgi:hypothetical protein
MGLPNSPLLLELQTIAHMHGTFYKHTTPNHCGLMATAHKVCTHPGNTSKEKLLLRIE